LQEAHTPGSVSDHRWLTPEEFGRRFGAADSDVAAVEAWLELHGLTVNKVHPGRIAVEFSGTAGQVAEAFHTRMHRYGIPGKTFVANAADPQIPAALGEVIRGISPLHSLHAQPLVKVRGKTGYDGKTHQATPEWTYPGAAGTVYEMTPADFAVQYDLGPVYKAGTTGGGQGIGILSASNVDLSLVQAYEKLFGLPTNVPTIVVDGNDPGQTSAATEAYLDLEQALAVAPGANAVLYTSAGSEVTDPLYTAGLRAVEDNLVSVISVSYGSCEAALGAGGNAAWAALWQEAAAQGITAFVAAGDAGSADCDNFDAQGFAIGGLAVNGLASSPYDIAVGGTDLYYSSYAAGANTLDAQIGSYWGATATNAPAVSLLRPVPEQAWNDAFGLNAADGGVYDINASTIVSGGGGASAAALYPLSGAVSGYPKPGWQSGPGVPSDKVRDIPDVSLFAGDGENFVLYPICARPGDCVNTNSGGAVIVTSVGGTSAAAPSMAGIQALVDEATKSRQGQANPVYYALAGKTLTAKPFRDLTVGGNVVPCYQGTANCGLSSSGATKGNYVETGFATTVGYDRATGLGSVDVANLISNWAGVAFRPSTTTLSVSPVAVAHGMPVAITATVAAKSGSGTPTGSVGLLSNDAVAGSNGLATLNLTGGMGAATLEDLPGGTYQLSAQYAGDGSFSESTSAPVTVTVTPEKATLNNSGWVLNPVDGDIYPLSAGMWIPYGSTVYLDSQVVGVNEGQAAAGQTTPAMGAIVFTDKTGTTAVTGTAPLNGVGLAEWVPASLAVGSHAITAAFAGDASYGAATAMAANVNVFKGTTTISLQPMTTSVAAGSNVTVDLVMTSDYVSLSGSLPTGTVAITLGGQTMTVASPFRSWGTGAGVSLEAVVTFTKVPAGILPLMASYSGDTNWNGSSSLFGSVESLASLPAPVVTITANGSTFSPNQMVTLTGTVTGTANGKAPTGSVAVSWEDGNALLSAALVAKSANSAGWSVTFPAWQLANGTNALLAVFGGDGNYSAQSSNPTGITLNGGDFSLLTTTPEVAVVPGKAGTGTVLISPSSSAGAGYSGAVVISCSAPAGITCAAVTAAPNVGGGVSDGITFNVAATVAAGTYPAVVTAVGGGHTHTAQILVTYTPVTATPTFSPVAGTYAAAQTVTIADGGAGAVVYYTTNGTTPTTASAMYTGPIAVSAAETLKAVAMATGSTLSAVGSAVYTITPPQATFTGGSGTLNFPLTVVGATSAAEVVTFKNTGTVALTIASFSFAGTNASSFLISAKTCTTTLAAGASCTLSIACKPTVAGALTASLVAHDNAAGAPQTVALTGIGGSATPAVVLSPATLTFASTAVGSASAAQVVTVRNTGLVPVVLSSLAVSGTNASSFGMVSKTCPASLAAGASCTVSVDFKPAASGALSAKLLATDDATGSPQAVTLTGTGK
jgi:hypothetical protein